MKFSIFLTVATVFLYLQSAAWAALTYDWTFGTPGPTGPIEGTITFSSLNPGDGGGFGLTPDSLVITSAPGHSFTSYVIGDEMIGDLVSWNTLYGPASGPWAIDADDVIVGGVAEFQRDFGFEYFELRADVNASLTTVDGAVFTHGFPQFTLEAIPEPSSLSLLGLGIVFVSVRRKQTRRGLLAGVA